MQSVGHSASKQRKPSTDIVAPVIFDDSKAMFDVFAKRRMHPGLASRHYAKSIQRVLSTLVPKGSRVLDVGCGNGDLLASLDPKAGLGIDISGLLVDEAKRRHPHLAFVAGDIENGPLPVDRFDYIVLSDVVALLGDVQATLQRLRQCLLPGGRIIVTTHNHLWQPALAFAEWIGQKTQWPSTNWLSKDDLSNLLYLSGYSVVRQGTDVLVPAATPSALGALNAVAAKLPGLESLALVLYFVARDATEAPQEMNDSTVSIVCPCRNERGNIEAAVKRTPLMGKATELIFVDGNSTDGTVEEIERVIANYSGPLELRLVKQGDGKGKGDAVRKGFAAARYETLMILDSDLTVAPEDLPKFHRALIESRGDFVNGVRLVYPMEGEAMRFLNHIGNKFFSLALSWVLEQPIKDSLCGTKVLSKKSYEKIAANRDFFGEFDPFGDFDLLFGAARLNLRIVDLPIRYRARTYGETKISRFTHGWLLLKMTAFGFGKFRLGGAQ